MNESPDMRPLSERELADLQLWQRKMVWSFAFATVLLVVALAVQLTVGLPRSVEVVVGVLWMGLVAYGIVVQFSARCPRCGARLGLQTRLLVPPYCMRCKTPLKRPKRR
jgi:lipopolysaccharide export LptBFGC system permease protein LptF